MRRIDVSGATETHQEARGRKRAPCPFPRGARRILKQMSTMRSDAIALPLNAGSIRRYGSSRKRLHIPAKLGHQPSCRRVDNTTDRCYDSQRFEEHGFQSREMERRRGSGGGHSDHAMAAAGVVVDVVHVRSRPSRNVLGPQLPMLREPRQGRLMLLHTGVALARTGDREIHRHGPARVCNPVCAVQRGRRFTEPLVGQVRDGVGRNGPPPDSTATGMAIRFRAAEFTQTHLQASHSATAVTLSCLVL